MSIMRLLPGDLADRQTIIELKINHCNAEFDEDKQDKPRGGVARVLVNKNVVNVAPFLDELDLIRKRLEKDWVPDLNFRNKVEDYDKLYDKLSDTNSQLWDAEDKIRALKVAPESIQRILSWLQQVADTALLIVDLNDTRAELIKQINALWNYTTQEKMY